MLVRSPTLAISFLAAASQVNALAMNGWGPSSSPQQFGIARKNNVNNVVSPYRTTKLSSTVENNTDDANTEIDTDLDTANGASSTSELSDDAINVKTTDILSLDSIRSTLIRQEETIIFAIIERAQYRRNQKVYQTGGFPALGRPLGVNPDCDFLQNNSQLSFLEYMLIGTEALHCGVRRYTSPEEHAFFPGCLPEGPNAALPQLEYPQDLLSAAGDASSVNFNEILLKKYIEWIVPSIAQGGDDEQHGSTVLADIAVLQALSKRVHYGKFVAESKYRSNPEEYERLVNNNDAEGVMELLTNAVVEEKVLRRAKLKATTYGREPLMTELPDKKLESDVTAFISTAAASAVASALEALGEKNNAGKIDPSVIEDIYRKFIIPLTKDIEVAYLFKRCGKEPPPEYAPHRLSVDLTLS